MGRARRRRRGGGAARGHAVCTVPSGTGYAVSDPFVFADDLGPAKIVHVHEPRVGLRATMVVDNVACGPSIGGLRVAPDVSTEECFRLARAMTFKNAAADVREIGAQLSAAKILEGSVRKVGNQLRVTAQLVEVSTGFQLRSLSYNRELGDVFSTQDELANTVAADLTLRQEMRKSGPFLVARHAA